MELNEESDGPRRWSGGVEGYWYWAGASSVQLLWAILSLRRGYAGDSRLMPFKAFGVASLFVGSAASATIGSLRASGIHSVTLFLFLCLFTSEILVAIAVKGAVLEV